MISNTLKRQEILLINFPQGTVKIMPIVCTAVVKVHAGHFKDAFNIEIQCRKYMIKKNLFIGVATFLPAL